MGFVVFAMKKEGYFVEIKQTTKEYAPEENPRGFVCNIFSVNDVLIKPSFNDFFSKLHVFEYDERPNISKRGLIYCNFGNFKKQKVVFNKEIFIKSEGGFNFSDKNINTNIVMKFTKLLPNHVNIEVKTRYIDENYNEKEHMETRLFPIRKTEGDIVDPFSVKLMDDFRKAMCIGPDLLLNIFTEYKNLVDQDKTRVVFEDGHMIYVGKGDIFEYLDGQWSMKRGDAGKGEPMVRVVSSGKNEVALDFWGRGSEGKKSFTIYGSKFKPSIITTRDDFIQNINLRTRTAVSFSIGKKRYILAEKQCLYKKKNVWYKGSIEEILIAPEAEEYFVFDKVDKRQAGNYLIGHLLNKERTISKKIERPLRPKITSGQSNSRRR